MKIATIFMAAMLLGACTKVEVLDARAERKSGNDVAVYVRLPAKALKTIRDRELYFSINLIECRDEPNRYPIEPFVRGVRASTFKFNVREPIDVLYGEVPEDILLEYESPCVKLGGGGYLTGKLSSNSVPLVPQS